MRTGIARLPLHYGKAPPWLFERMTKLVRQIAIVVVEELGPEEFLRKLADPFWFQALGCVLGFDWHSSGVTTTVCGALKMGLRGLEKDLGLFVAGGKGGVSRKTPQEIETFGEKFALETSPLVYASRMAAKVDNAALQDGYQLYHHTFIFTKKGLWCVVQQGMNESNRFARRYHWLSTGVKDFVCEPHSAICSDGRGMVLNMVAAESEQTRQVATAVSAERPEKLIAELKKIENLHLPQRHPVIKADIHPERLGKIFLKTYERQPQNFESLLEIQGVGPKSIRALSLISELIYGAKPSFRDPARYSFAHGGKDGHPYPVDRPNYDRSIEVLRKAIAAAKLGNKEKLEAFKRLSAFAE